MHRSGSLLAVVIVQLFGSLLMSGIAAMVLMGALSATPMDLAAHHEGRAALLTVAAALGIVVAWGVATALGLLWKRTWALVSTFIFSFLALATGIGMLVVAAAAHTSLPAAQRVDILLALVLTGLAVWWIGYFAGARTQRDFAAARRSGPMRLPVSLAVIGWTLLGGGALAIVLVPVVGAHYGFLVAGQTLRGRPAQGAMVGIGAVSLIVGLGVIELRRWARTAAIIWLVLLLLNAVAQWAVQQNAGGMDMAATVSLVIAACLAQIYFLWTRRPAFAPQALATAAAGTSEPKRRWRRA